MCGSGVSGQQGRKLRCVVCFGGFDECDAVADLKFAEHD